MSVTVEQPDGFDGTRYVITAEPDSGKAFWRKEVRADPKWKDPMRLVSRALRRAIKIDSEFSLEAIERRKTAKEKKRGDR